MAEVYGKPNIDLRLGFTVGEAEARALEALAGYGDDAFIKAFYEKLGKAYMEKHEQGLRSFLRSVRTFLPPILSKVDEARLVFTPAPRKPWNGGH